MVCEAQIVRTSEDEPLLELLFVHKRIKLDLKTVKHLNIIHPYKPKKEVRNKGP